VISLQALPRTFLKEAAGYGEGFGPRQVDWRSPVSRHSERCGDDCLVGSEIRSAESARRFGREVSTPVDFSTERSAPIRSDRRDRRSLSFSNGRNSNSDQMRRTGRSTAWLEAVYSVWRCRTCWLRFGSNGGLGWSDGWQKSVPNVMEVTAAITWRI